MNNIIDFNKQHLLKKIANSVDIGEISFTELLQYASIDSENCAITKALLITEDAEGAIAIYSTKCKNNDVVFFSEYVKHKIFNKEHNYDE